MIKKLILFLYFLYPLLANAQKVTLNVCTDESPQPPFIILDKEKIIGIAPDILRQAIKKVKKDVEIHLNIELMPWTRCFHLANKGEVDAILNASYNKERAEFLDYPPGSGEQEKKPCSSQYKIACSGYVVITLKSDKFDYNGNPKDLPIPVRVARGFAIVSEIEKLFSEKDIEIAKSDLVNIKKLLRDKVGSVVAYSSVLYELKQYNDISQKIKIHKHNYVMKSYYMPFSKRSKTPDKIKMLLWSQVGNITNNDKDFKKIYNKYVTK